MFCIFCKRCGQQSISCYHRIKRFGSNHKKILTKTSNPKFIKTWKEGRLQLATRITSKPVSPKQTEIKNNPTEPTQKSVSPKETENNNKLTEPPKIKSISQIDIPSIIPVPFIDLTHDPENRLSERIID